MSELGSVENFKLNQSNNQIDKHKKCDKQTMKQIDTHEELKSVQNISMNEHLEANEVCQINQKTLDGNYHPHFFPALLQAYLLASLSSHDNNSCKRSIVNW